MENWRKNIIWLFRLPALACIRKWDMPPLRIQLYEKIQTAVDIVYTPAKTRFMELVEEAGGRAVGGLDMLIYQGIIAFERGIQVIVTEEIVETRPTNDDREVKQQVKTMGNHVIMTGFMGAGKTTGGESAGEKEDPIDTDQLIEKKAGMTISRILRPREKNPSGKWKPLCWKIF